LVVCGIRKTVHAAYQAGKENMSVSVTSVYNKLNGLEVNTSAQLVRYAAKELQPIIKKLGGAQAALLPGYRVKILDGNVVKATEHRLKELRATASGALPGKSLVVFDPQLRLPIDVFPCEDGHAQERSLLTDVLSTVEANDVWIADRNFCTRDFLLGIAARQAFFVIREHKNLPWQAAGSETFIGPSETGEVFEQAIEISDETGRKHTFRRIRVVLKTATRDGDKNLFILTGLPESVADAVKIAALYRRRWTIETAFQDLALHLNSEINTLGYPPAALFGFCVALIAYMILATIKATIASVHGTETVENKISGYYLADEISGTYRGMEVAILPLEWAPFRYMSLVALVDLLKQLSANIKLSAFLKHPRGPKKKKVKPKLDPKHPHVSTARILAMRKK
jgi:IS4 transposase